MFRGGSPYLSGTRIKKSVPGVYQPGVRNKKGLDQNRQVLVITGAPGTTRTCGLRIRSPSSYPSLTFTIHNLMIDISIAYPYNTFIDHHSLSRRFIVFLLTVY
jgi:hypothetical protein